MADPTLHSFYIFNDTYGPREGEEIKKVLYYYPPDTDENTKIKDVGFSEAMIKFVETFTDEPCQSVHTKKQRHLYSQPEPNFYMVLKLHIQSSKKQMVEDASNTQEYHDENLHDSVYSSVLVQAYRMFKIFMGSFSEILARSNNDVNVLKGRFDRFYNRYLVSLRLEQCDILDVFNGISWLPLDKSMYLRFQCLVNRLEAKYSQISYTAFLCNDYLVWSGLPQKDMQIIYQYLITSLFPSQHEKEISSSTGASPRRVSGHHYARFLTSLDSVPRVFIEDKGGCREFYLIVYKALSVCLCALVDVSRGPLGADFYKKFDADLGGTLTDLASDVRPLSPHRASQSENPVKFIYFNHMNLATKSTVHVDTRKTRLVNIPIEVLSTIADINADLRVVDAESECSVKTAGEYWVVCKRAETRELYAVINNREANLIQINDEVGKLCMNQFTNMFLID